MTLRALIFDVDGTLADTEEVHRQSFNRAFEAAGLGWHWSAEHYARLLAVTGGKERIAAYIRSLELPAKEQAALDARIPALHAAKTAHYTEAVSQGIGLRPGIERLMNEAVARRLTLAIATTTTRANIEALMQSEWGDEPLKHFAVVGAGDDVARKKPAPDIYLFVLERLGYEADECVALEDSANGMRAAKAAGIFTVVTPSPWSRGEDFSLADLVVDSLDTADANGAWLDITRLEHEMARSRSASVREIGAA